MALLTIVHRALGTFLRVQLAAAGAVGVAVYAGLQGVERAEIATYPAAIALAAFMGTAQVIPQLGGLIGALPIVLIALARQDDPAAAVALLVVYVIALQVVKMAVGARLGRDLNVRPAIALPAFAVISQIGLVWLLLSAPILVVARNSVRYLRGRLSEPPLPAGVMPGERRRRSVAPPGQAAGARGPAVAPIPSVYRDRVAPPAAAPAARPAPPLPVPSRAQPIPGGSAS
jgi:predicted PurR-regulated permease PerM